WQALVLVHRQPESIIKLLTAIEFAALEHLLEESWSANTRPIKVFVPQLEVLHGGVQAGGTDGVKVGEAQTEGFVLAFSLVTQRIVLYDFPVIVPEMRVSHTQRFEDILS